MSMTLTKEKKGDIFRMLATKSTYETGIEFGFDKHYKDATGLKNAVYRIYKQVLVEPQEYFVTQEMADKVKETMRTRSVYIPEKTLAEKKAEALLAENDVKAMTLMNRDKMSKLISMKVDRIMGSYKRIDETPLQTLATAFGILFDKSQILQGEATENVAVLAKIDEKLSPEEAMAAILKGREANQVEQDRTSKRK